MKDKVKTLNIRITQDKYNEIILWANKLQIKVSPFCLFILMEKLEHLKSFSDTANLLESLSNPKSTNNQFEI